MAVTPEEDSSDFPYDRCSKLPRSFINCYHLHCVARTKNSVLIKTSTMADSFVVLRTCLPILYFVRMYLSVAWDLHNKQHLSYVLYILLILCFVHSTDRMFCTFYWSYVLYVLLIICFVHSLFRALQFNYYSSNQQMHKILFKLL
jgi:hypothetical protein